MIQVCTCVMMNCVSLWNEHAIDYATASSAISQKKKKEEEEEEKNQETSTGNGEHKTNTSIDAHKSNPSSYEANSNIQSANATAVYCGRSVAHRVKSMKRDQKQSKGSERMPSKNWLDTARQCAQFRQIPLLPCSGQTVMPHKNDDNAEATWRHQIKNRTRECFIIIMPAEYMWLVIPRQQHTWPSLQLSRPRAENGERFVVSRIVWARNESIVAKRVLPFWPDWKKVDCTQEVSRHCVMAAYRRQKHMIIMMSTSL